jgi:chromosome segregation ATPase
MDEDSLRRIIREEIQPVRGEVEKVRGEVEKVRGEVRTTEERLAENGRNMFRQLADLYRTTIEKVEHLEKHLGERLDATRGAIEALRSSLERQDFRADELGRRMTAIETRYEESGRERS